MPARLPMPKIGSVVVPAPAATATFSARIKASASASPITSPTLALVAG
jgi:hypothetical protein